MLYTGMFLGIIALIFVCPTMFCIAINKLDEDNVGGTALAFIPIVNMIKAEKSYYGKFGIITAGNIGLILFTAIRLAVAFTVPQTSSIVHLITVILFVIGLLAFVIGSVKFTWDALRDSGHSDNTSTRLIISLVYGLGMWWYASKISKMISRDMEVYGDESD